MKLTYKNQLMLSVIIIIVFFTLNVIFKNWVFSSIGWCLCGLLWIIHPALTKNIKPTKRNRMMIRLTGVVLIIIGLTTRFYL